MKYYKCLDKDRTGGYSGFKWPEEGVPLVPIYSDLELCKTGYHVCEARDLLRWIQSGDVHEFLPEGDMLLGEDKVCFRGGRLGKKVLDWRANLLFQADVTQHILHKFEDTYPEDSRVRDCIQAKRDKAAGRDVDLAAAEAAAWSAAGAAAFTAAKAAAWSAAGAAAGSAAWSAAWGERAEVATAERKWQLRQLKYRMGIYKTPATRRKIYE